MDNDLLKKIKKNKNKKKTTTKKVLSLVQIHRTFLLFHPMVLGGCYRTS
jgi:hypothetical protein